MTVARAASSSALPAGSSSTSDGISISNIEPDQLFRPVTVPREKKGRPSAPQCEAGRSPLAMPTRLVSRASEASRS